MSRLWGVSEDAMREFSECVVDRYEPDKDRVLGGLLYVLGLGGGAVKKETNPKKKRCMHENPPISNR